jgi:hypothetical protein
MKKTDYVPSKESDFYPWSKNLVQVSTNNSQRWMIPAEDITILSTSGNNYETKYQIAFNPVTRTKITIQAKNDAKKSFTAVIREFCMGHLLHNRLVTNDDRDMLQLPIYDPTPTPVPVPVTSPVGQVDMGTHQRHVLHVTDSKEVSPRGGLPADVHAFETWRKMGGDAPQTDAEFTYLATSTTSSLTVDYALAEVGQRVWYRFRWLNTRNQPGPWSENIISAIVP